MKITNKKTFQTALAEAVKLHGTVRDGIQVLCNFSMTQAGNNNYTYINAMMNADFKGSDVRAMQNYFEDHNDVTLNSEEGQLVFKNNNTTGFKFVPATKTWWEYKPTAGPSVISPLALLQGVIKKTEAALDNNGKGATIAEGEETLARSLIDAIKGNGIYAAAVVAATNKLAAVSQSIGDEAHSAH
jgi:hypothetical protein